jgi:hypothetical protein
VRPGALPTGASGTTGLGIIGLGIGIPGISSLGRSEPADNSCRGTGRLGQSLPTFTTYSERTCSGGCLEWNAHRGCQKKRMLQVQTHIERVREW